jgi:hypothetical protein
MRPGVWVPRTVSAGLVSPPRDRPRASPSTARASTQSVTQPPFSGPGGVLVGPDAAGVDAGAADHRWSSLKGAGSVNLVLGGLDLLVRVCGRAAVGVGVRDRPAGPTA